VPGTGLLPILALHGTILRLKRRDAQIPSVDETKVFPNGKAVFKHLLGTHSFISLKA
jgi:hypothetical protein